MRTTSDPLFRYLKRPTRRRLARVVAAYHDIVWRVALRTTRDAEDAEDVCQEVFLKLLLDPPAADTVESPRGFLAWRVVSVAGRQRRSAARRVRREAEYARRLAATALGGESPGDEFVDGEALRGAIESLPERLRLPLELRYIAEIPVAEIARVLGVSEREVRRRQEDARERLRRRFPRILLPAIVAGSVAEDVAAAPPSLVASLFEIAKSGGALAAPTGTSGTVLASAGLTPKTLTGTAGGALMSAKKMALVVGAAGMLIVLSTQAVLWVMDPSSGERIDDGEAPVVASPASPRADRSSDGELETAVDGVAKPIDDPAAPKPLISGRVTDARGDPVVGAKLFALDANAWANVVAPNELEAARSGDSAALIGVQRAYRKAAGDVPTVTTDLAGAYSFPALRRVDYRVIVVHPEHVPHEETLVESEALPGVVDVRLFDAHGISGTVLDTAGAPLAGVSVRAEEHDSALAAVGLGSGDRAARYVQRWERGRILFEPARVETDRHGRFHLGSLAPARFRLSAQRSGYATVERSQVAAGTADLVLTLELSSLVTGIVVDAGGQPVRGASVALVRAREREVHRFYDPSLERVRPFDAAEDEAVLTGPDGRFRIHASDVGPHDLRVRAEGFASLLAEITVAEGPHDAGALELTRGREISGIVRDSAGGAVADARVWVPEGGRSVRPAAILGRNESAVDSETRTGGDGRFVLRAVTERAVELLATHPDYGRGRVSLGEKSAELTIVMPPPLRVRGRVIDAASGDPVAGAEVATGFGRPAGAVTDESGEFECTDITADDLYVHTLNVRVSHPAYPTARTNVVVGSRSPEPITVLLSREAMLSGRVETPSGTPLADVSVYYEVRGMAPEAYHNPVRGLAARTNELGEFALPAPDGTRHLIVRPQVFLVVEPPDFATERIGPLRYPEVGSAWPELEVVVTPGVSVTGRVLDGDGDPVSGASIALVPEFEGEVKGLLTRLSALPRNETARSGSDGEFRLSHVAAGSYRLLVAAPGYASASLDGIDVADADVSRDVVLESGTTVEGRVVDRTGEPLPFVEVIAIDAASPNPPAAASSPFGRRMNLLRLAGTTGATTGPDGRFRLSGLPDRELSVIARAEGYEAGLAENVVPGAAPIEIVLERFSAVGGRVVSRGTGAPVREFVIEIIDVLERKRRQSVRGAMSDYRMGSVGSLRFRDPNGRYFFDGLVASEYELLLIAPGFRLEKKSCRLESGQELDVDFELDPGVELAGNVIDAETGGPVMNAIVNVAPRTVQDMTALMRANARERIRTGGDGSFRVGGLADGDHVVGVAHPFYELGLDGYVVNIPRGEPFVVELEPAGGLVGRLTGLAVEGEAGSRVRHSIELVPIGFETGDGEAGEDEPVPYALRHVGVRDDGRFSQYRLPAGEYRILVTRQEFEFGKSTAIGPTGGFVAHEEKGEPQEFDLGTVTVRARETVRVERALPSANR